MKRLTYLLGAATLLVATAGPLLVLSAAPASAHAEREVGKYTVEVGWETEPTYTGQPNFVHVGVTDSAGKPVDDIGDKLQVVVSADGKQSAPMKPELALERTGQHGVFNAPIIPTAPGIYTFHVTGAIKDQPINLTLSSSDSTFDQVVDPSTVQFPNKVPTAGDLAAKSDRLAQRVDTASTKATDAKDADSTTRTYVIILSVLVLIAIVLAIAAIWRSARTVRPGGATTTT